ncbi:MAG: YjzC family protein [Chloroflexota bacterium]|nr:YjzC family protein [Chloroflexota bacterium]
MARYKTGQKAPKTGNYDWDGYLGGTRTPRPTREEQRIRLTAGKTFPPINSADKGAWWRGPV